MHSQSEPPLTLQETAELRGKLAAWEEDWNAPGMEPMTGLSRGDVVIVSFPNSDLITFKRRPALVVEANNLNTGVPQVVICMITSNLIRSGHPSRVLIPLKSAEAAAAGLRTDSIIMTDNLATVLDKAISAKLGLLKNMANVDAALRHTLGL